MTGRAIDSHAATLEEAIDLIEDLACQAMWAPDKEGAGRDFGHSFISTYEHTCRYLAEVRPERWELTGWGMSLKAGQTL